MSERQTCSLLFALDNCMAYIGTCWNYHYNLRHKSRWEICVGLIDIIRYNEIYVSKCIFTNVILRINNNILTVRWRMSNTCLARHFYKSVSKTREDTRRLSDVKSIPQEHLCNPISFCYTLGRHWRRRIHKSAMSDIVE